LRAFQTTHPDLGRDFAIDGSDLPAYANGHRIDHSGKRTA
jgi:hypothetical protein